jgi:hypothetical protein
MFEEQGPDDMKSEFASCIEECFYSSLEGSYFKREMTKARDEKRIGCRCRTIPPGWSTSSGTSA